MRPANERRRYIVKSSFIGWAHTQNDPCISITLHLRGQWRHNLLIDIKQIKASVNTLTHEKKWPTFSRQHFEIHLYFFKNCVILTQIPWWICCHSRTTCRHVNSSPPSAAYMRRWTGSALVKKMACPLFGAKPLSEPMLGFCQLDPKEQTSVKI